MEFEAILFSLIRYELLAEVPSKKIVDLIDEGMLQRLYSVSKTFDVANIVASALEKLEKLSGEVGMLFKKQQTMAVYRCEQMNYELERISQLFDEREISYIPLKGAVLRNIYPQPWMRTSCDIDVLVKDKDLDKAVSCLEKELGYTQGEKGSHDISLFSKMGVSVELHYSLIEDDVMEKADAVFENVWDYARKAFNESERYELSDDMFYYYHIAHMAKHFLIGGCGIRPFIDVFLLCTNVDFDAQSRKILLEKGGLLDFAKQVELLSRVWLDGGEHTVLTQDMRDYILQGGAYGTLENMVAIQQTKRGGKFAYAMSRIWLPYGDLKIQYPAIEKRAWMLPFYQAYRWVRLAFGGRLGRSVRELGMNSALPQDKVDFTKNLLDRLGL